MTFLRNTLIILIVVLVVITSFCKYHRHMVTNFAIASLSQALHVSPKQVVVERVQELGLWRDKLNPFGHHSWTVNFTLPGGPKPSSGLAYVCNIDEPRLGQFRFLGIPGTSPAMPPQ